MDATKSKKNGHPAGASTYYAAADLGASSGRVILGCLTDGRMVLEEVARFHNGPAEREDGIHWDAQQLFDHVRQGINKAIAQSHGQLESVGVDTWGVDYGRLDIDDSLLEEPFHYRDDRTKDTVSQYFQKMPAQDLYAISGLQVQPFNTIFQLVAGCQDSQWVDTQKILFMPDLLTYWLSGRKVAEVTIASTSGLLDVAKRTWSPELCQYLQQTYDLPVPQVLAELVEPGTVVGPSLPGLLDQEIKVIAVPSHDTASAVVAVPAQTPNFAFISSGTWSLVGLELDAPVLSAQSREANLTNELGADGTVRYLQNVMGLWVFNECRRIWEEAGQQIDLVQLIAEASTLPPLECVIDINDERLFPPGDMPSRLQEIAAESGQKLAEDPVAITRCVMDSLALAYRRAIRQEQALAGREIEVVHIVGGGSKNQMLCQLTAEATGLPVVAGPTEGTALGNLLIQARACGAIQGGLDALRKVSRDSVGLIEYRPGALDIPENRWDAAESLIDTPTA